MSDMTELQKDCYNCRICRPKKDEDPNYLIKYSNAEEPYQFPQYGGGNVDGCKVLVVSLNPAIQYFGNIGKENYIIYATNRLMEKGDAQKFSESFFSGDKDKQLNAWHEYFNKDMLVKFVKNDFWQVLLSQITGGKSAYENFKNGTVAVTELFKCPSQSGTIVENFNGEQNRLENFRLLIANCYNFLYQQISKNKELELVIISAAGGREALFRNTTFKEDFQIKEISNKRFGANCFYLYKGMINDKPINIIGGAHLRGNRRLNPGPNYLEFYKFLLKEQNLIFDQTRKILDNFKNETKI